MKNTWGDYMGVEEIAKTIANNIFGVTDKDYEESKLIDC